MLSAKSAIVVASFVILHSQVFGQVAVIAERAAGAGAIESYYCAEKDELGAIEIVRNEPRLLADRAEIEWRVFGNGAGPAYRARLPFHSGGAIQRIGECRFLVSGFRYFSLDPAIGVGVICRIRLAGSGDGITIEEQTVIEPDPRGLLWDDEQDRLYVHDARGGKLYAASWSGWPEEDDAPTLPTSAELVEIAGLASVPILRGSEGTLRHAERTHGGGVLFGNDPMEGPGSLYQICPLGPTWNVRELGERRAEMWRVEDEDLQGSDEIVVVTPELGRTRPFQVLDLLSGASVAAGEVPAGSNTARVSIPGHRPGSPVRIVGAGLRPSNVLLPLLRAGEPIPSPSGTLRPSVVPAGAATVGNNRDFAVGTELWFSNGATRVSLHLGLAIRSADDNDPIVDVGGGAALLDADLQLPIPLTSSDLHQFVNDVSRSVPIGSDDGLAGSIAYWQWVAIFADGSLACSDIVGHSIWPRRLGPGGLAEAMSGDSGKARLQWKRQLESEGFQTGGVFRSLVGGLSGSR